MAFFAIASLGDSCKYAKAPQGAKLFLFFDNLASGYELLALSFWLLALGSWLVRRGYWHSSNSSEAA